MFRNDFMLLVIVCGAMSAKGMKKEEAIVNLSTQYQKTMLIYLIPE
jgi:hypothetical protein